MRPRRRDAGRPDRRTGPRRPGPGRAAGSLHRGTARRGAEDQDRGRPVTPPEVAAARPRGVSGGRPPAPAPLLEIVDLTVRFGPVRAVDGVSLEIRPGPFGLALVGESGSGKTTIG